MQKRNWCPSVSEGCPFLQLILQVGGEGQDQQPCAVLPAGGLWLPWRDAAYEGSQMGRSPCLSPKGRWKGGCVVAASDVRCRLSVTRSTRRHALLSWLPMTPALSTRHVASE